MVSVHKQRRDGFRQRKSLPRSTANSTSSNNTYAEKDHVMFVLYYSFLFTTLLVNMKRIHVHVIELPPNINFIHVTRFIVTILRHSRTGMDLVIMTCICRVGEKVLATLHTVACGTWLSGRRQTM